MVINYVDGMVWSCMWVHLIRDIMDCKSIQKNLIHCIVILSYDLANCVYKLIQIGKPMRRAAQKAPTSRGSEGGKPMRRAAL